MVDFPHILDILDDNNHNEKHGKWHEDNMICIFSGAIGNTRLILVKV